MTPRERAAEFPELLEVPTASLPSRERPRVVLAIGTLAAGGAERQLVAFACARRTREVIEPIIVITSEPDGAAGHYVEKVRRDGIPIAVAGRHVDAEVIETLRNAPSLVGRLAALPPVIRTNVAMMAGEFLRLKPDCVHAWLDVQNVWSGVAALVVGVPQVILSTRNVNPSHFPAMHQPWFQEWYRLLVRCPRVSVINNSRAGAADYAAWLGCEGTRIKVIPNGVDPDWVRRPHEGEIEAVRSAIVGSRAWDARPQVIGGVFRLSEEKQPHRWLEVVRRVARERPNTVFFHAGEGPLAHGFHESAADLVASGRLRLLGRRSDVPTLLAASDALLHLARFEGTPNVILEAAQLGCPVVATRAGGTPEAMEDGATGYLRDADDLQGLGDALLAILCDHTLRARFAARGPRFIAERFSLDRMVESTLRCYSGTRVVPEGVVPGGP